MGGRRGLVGEGGGGGEEIIAEKCGVCVYRRGLLNPDPV